MVEGSNLPRQQRPAATIRFADAGYFRTMGIALAAGRLLEDADAAAGGRGLDAGRRAAVAAAGSDRPALSSRSRRFTVARGRRRRR